MTRFRPVISSGEHYNVIPEQMFICLSHLEAKSCKLWQPNHLVSRQPRSGLKCTHSVI
jgi:hypothetical protein